jgi:AcrR family transcriptional regulator
MSFRQSKTDVLSRARSPEDKGKVREAFINAGRKLFAEHPPSEVSLRKIAAEAGYAPGSIYQYFSDQRELFAHIRMHDMHAATEELRKKIARTRDPAKRVTKLFVATAEYWLDHMDDFLVIFPAPGRRTVPLPGGVLFGRSPVVQESLKLYYETVEDFFRTLPHPPMPPRLAADMLMAAVHGTIVFPYMTRTMEWSDTRTMVVRLVNTVVRQWTAAAEAEED